MTARLPLLPTTSAPMRRTVSPFKYTNKQILKTTLYKIYGFGRKIHIKITLSNKNFLLIGRILIINISWWN